MKVLQQSPLKGHTLIFCTLMLGFIGVYLFTYSGRMESSDTRGMLDVLQSLYFQGDELFDTSAFYNFPPPQLPHPETVPLAHSAFEPMQLWLALPLLALGNTLTGIGLAHSVWLFNVVICAALVGVVYLYAVQRGYNARTAILAAVLLGLGSIFWPYSKTFFREPLATLLLFLAAWVLNIWREEAYRRWRLVGGVLLLLGASWLTKEAVVFALPALLLLALPQHRLWRWLFSLLVGVGAAFVVVSLWVAVGGGAGANGLRPAYAALLAVTGWPLERVAQLQWYHEVLHSYLLSVGGSLWGTSPVLLLVLPAGWLSYKSGKMRDWVIFGVLVLSFALGYALLRGTSWFGGLAWPPRFLIPVVPFGIVAALPYLALAERQRGVLLSIGLVAVYAVWVQLSGVTLPWEAYGDVLPPEAQGLGEWGGGLNVLAYLRWARLPTLWAKQPLDWAWVRLNVAWWPLVSLALVSGAGALLWLSFRGRVLARQVALLGVGALLGVYSGLRAIYPDPLYDGQRVGLQALLPLIEAETAGDDVLFLSNQHYAPFFMNYARFSTPRVVTLSDQPGEQPSPEQAPLLRSNNPDLLLTKISAALIFNFAAQRENLWLLSDASAWLPWRVRPIERFMVKHFFPIREVNSDPPDPEARLMEFSTVPAPDAEALRWPEDVADVRFGTGLRLLGSTAPLGKRFNAGAVLPLVLYWQAEQPLEQLYTVAWFVVDAAGTVVAQGYDSQPQWGFSPPPTWQVGVPVADNRALRLPERLSAGTYRIWVRVYNTNQPEQILKVSGRDQHDAQTALLPWVITLNPR